MDYVAIGRKIKYYRNKVNMTQAQLAEKLDVSAKYVSSIERGISTTSLNKLEEVAKILGVNVTLLIADCDSNSSNYAMSEISALIKEWTPEQKEMLIGLIQEMDKYFSQAVH